MAIHSAPSDSTHGALVPLDQASNDALAWWDDYQMLNDLDLGNDLDAVLSAAHDHGLTTVADLRRDAKRVIARVTGVDHINNFTTGPTANDLHRTRNIIASLIFAAQVRHGSNPKSPYDLIARLPSIAPRHGSKRRPLYDDEVLLTRSAAVHTLHVGGRSLPVASQYALAESGAYPMETTSVTPTHFDDVTSPTTVLLPGVSSWSSERRVRLTPFAARLLADALDRHLAAGANAQTWRLCFRGGSCKASASASAGQNLKNLSKKVGITQPALEGSASTRWRVRKELQDKGEVAALRLMGKVKQDKDGRPMLDVGRVYDFLNLPPESTPPSLDDDEDEDFATW